MSSDPALIVYGVPFSQPVRAVLWLLLWKRRPFELRLVNPGSSGDNACSSAASSTPAGIAARVTLTPSVSSLPSPSIGKAR